MAERKSRAFLGVLYPDAENYDCQDVLARLADVFTEWAYVLHDADTDENGELKKAHYHWIGKLDSPALLSTVCGGRKLGIPENGVEYCKNWKYSVRYLIHKDDPEKFQYSPDSVTHNIDLQSILAGRQAEVVAVKAIRQYIKDTHCVSTEQLLDFCLDNGYWSEYRRSFAIWACLMREVKERKIEYYENCGH